MVEILNAPENDRSQVISEHDADSFVYDPTFFGIERSADVVFLQLTLAEAARSSRSAVSISRGSTS
jgi:4-oxalocrotonate tautomerase